MFEISPDRSETEIAYLLSMWSDRSPDYKDFAFSGFFVKTDVFWTLVKLFSDQKPTEQMTPQKHYDFASRKKRSPGLW